MQEPKRAEKAGSRDRLREMIVRRLRRNIIAVESLSRGDDTMDANHCSDPDVGRQSAGRDNRRAGARGTAGSFGENHDNGSNRKLETGTSEQIGKRWIAGPGERIVDIGTSNTLRLRGTGTDLGERLRPGRRHPHRRIRSIGTGIPDMISTRNPHCGYHGYAPCEKHRQGDMVMPP